MRRMLIEFGSMSVVISEASVGMGIKRDLIRDELTVPEHMPREYRIAAMFMYPDMLASVVEHTGFDSWPPSVEEFVNEWPSRFFELVRDAVYELNPHWFPNFNEEEVKKKEISAPTG